METISSFRFTTKQFLLLFVLIGLVGGLFSAVLRRPFRVRFTAMDNFGDSRLALAGPEGMVQIDLKTGRMGKLKPVGNAWEEQTDPEILHFHDESTLALLQTNTIGSRQLIYISADNHQIDRQIVFPNARYDVSIRPKIVAQIQRGDSAAFYDASTCRRIKIESAAGFAGIQSIDSSSDGKLIGVVRNVGGVKRVELVSAEDGNVVSVWNREAERIRFVRNQPWLLAINRQSISLLRLGEQDFSWEIFLDVPLDPRFIETSPAGQRFAVGIRQGRQIQLRVFQLDSGTQVGQLTVKQALVGSGQQLFRFVDENRIAFLPINSDSGVVMVDLKSGRQYFVARFHRWLVAFVFPCLFVVWCWTWGRLALRQQKFAQSSTVDIATTAYRENPPTADGSLAEPAFQNRENNDQFVGQLNARAERRQRLVGNMMSIGGVFAIVWSVVPMFFFGSSDLVFRQLFFFRLSVAMFGLVVGLLAASRGFGRFQNWLNLTAALQVLNLVGFDLVNLSLGIAELGLINQNKPAQTAEPNHSELKRPAIASPNPRV